MTVFYNESSIKVSYDNSVTKNSIDFVYENFK